MQTFGNYLRRQREAIKVSLREVAHLTHITERYLDYIEKDDYAKIPEGPYVRGYISSYATAIGINPHEALDRFDSLRLERNNAKDTNQRAGKDRITQASVAFLFHKKNWFLTCSTILLFLTFGVYHLFSQDQKKASVTLNFQEARDIGLQATLPTKSKDNVSKLSLKEYAMSTGRLGNPQRDVGRGDNLRAQVVSQEKTAKAQGEEPSEPAALASLPPEKTGEVRSNRENNTEILKAAVCADVKDKIPHGENNIFPWSMAKIYIWNLIKCGNSHSSIRHIYYFKGQQISDVLLDIKSSLWRTWSCKTLLDKRFIGPWRVDITSSDGGLLQRLYFEIR